MRSIILATMMCAAFLSAFAAEGRKVSIDAKGLKVMESTGAKVSDLKANLPGRLSFSCELGTEGKVLLSIANLPPKNYGLHADSWHLGKYTVEELASGVEIELPAGVSEIVADKNVGRKLSLADRKKWSALKTSVKSSLDGTMQPCYFWAPAKAATEAVPLIVGLHTWSGDITQLDHYRTVQAEAECRGWAFVGPNFRGPNSTPQGCGSEFAVQDIVDAVDFAKAKTRINPKRVYIIGGSGGGHMTLLMLGRHPEVFAAGAAFCPITDVARWHDDSILDHPGRGKGYARMLESACGGLPADRREEYAARSPLTWLKNAKAAGVPAYICTGIHDGWTGSVPVGHSFRAFNALCKAGDSVSEEDIAFIEANQKMPEGLDCGRKDDPFYHEKIRIHFRRTSGNVRLTIFEGGHGGNFQAGFDFLSRQVKGTPADWTLPAKAKGSEEHLAR